jgi:hypothetical protein
MRDSMVDYARTISPLQEKLKGMMSHRGRPKSQLACVSLEWSDANNAAFKDVINSLSTLNKRTLTFAYGAHRCVMPGLGFRSLAGAELGGR